MIRTARKVLAALSALALVALATPSTAQTARPLTPQERAARGLDIVRYCAPQIAAYGRDQASWGGPASSVAEGVSTLVKALLDNDYPQTLTYVFNRDLDQLSDPARAALGVGTHTELTLCIYGRAIALDAERFDALGWLTVRNNFAVEATVSPASGDTLCSARKNGGLCTMMLTAGKHRLKVSFLDGREFDIGEIQFEAGQPFSLTLNP